MAITFYVLIHPTDAQIIELFDQLVALKDGSQVHFAIGGVPNLPRTSPYVVSLENSLEYSLIHANYGLQNIGIRLSRNTSPHENNASLSGHPFYTTVMVTVPDQHYQQPYSPEDAIAISMIITRFVRERGLLPIVATKDSTTAELQNNILSALQNSAQDQIVRTDEFFKSLQERFLAQSKAADEKLTDRTRELEEAYQFKQDQLRLEKEQLETTRQELDDRSNTHARRELRKDLARIASDRQKSFTLSPETTRLRIPIHAVFVSTLIATLIGAAWSLYVWSKTGSTTWDAATVSASVKTAFFTFSFVTVSGLYISWMNRWFDKHADAQFQTKQFEIDINRATWAVEAALEWKSSQNEQMPATLLEGISRNLFDAKITNSVDYSPLEMLASSILGSAANLKLDVGGAKVDLDRKSLKQISADSPKGSA